MERRNLSPRAWFVLVLGAVCIAALAGRSSVGQQQTAQQPTQLPAQVGRYQVSVASSGVDRDQSSHPLVVIDTVTGRVWMRDAVFDGRWTDYGTPVQGAKKPGRP